MQCILMPALPPEQDTHEACIAGTDGSRATIPTPALVLVPVPAPYTNHTDTSTRISMA
jgi:hypothetical protein